MKKRKSGSKEGKGGDSHSRLIDARIKELNDWRGETLARVRNLIEFGRVVHAEMHALSQAAAAAGAYKGILEYVTAPLVSIDFRGNPHSAMLDAPYTKVMDGDFDKIVAWYDNEWGYSSRCVDLLRYMATRGI